MMSLIANHKLLCFPMPSPQPVARVCLRVGLAWVSDGCIPRWRRSLGLTSLWVVDLLGIPPSFVVPEQRDRWSEHWCCGCKVSAMACSCCTNTYSSARSLCIVHHHLVLFAVRRSCAPFTSTLTTPPPAPCWPTTIQTTIGRLIAC